MRRGIFYTIVALCVLLTGCDSFRRKHQQGAAAEVNGHFLLYSTLDSLTVGLSPEDSTRAADLYIRQWAKDILLYDRARKDDDPQIDALVEDYRRSLYVHAYEQRLVEHRMPTEVEDTLVAEIYARHSDRFRLRESIVRGLLIVVPQGAPDQKKLSQWLETPTDEEALENIEKYAYRYASGYELFTDRWLTAQQLQLHMPFAKDQLNDLLRKKTARIVLEDSLSVYMLQLTDSHIEGEPMPIDYARPEIEKVILSQRQVDFLREERERLYDEAVRYKHIRFYEKK